METLIYPDSRLGRICTPVENFDDELKCFAKELLSYCFKRFGLGMAAPQVGKSIRLVVINTTLEQINNKYPSFLVNPILRNLEGLSRFKEGCLSVPNVYAWVERANTFDVDYQDLDGEQKTLRIENTSEDVFGTVIQHEVDHLDGVEFIDRLEPFEKNKIMGRLAKLRRKKK